MMMLLFTVAMDGQGYITKACHYLYFEMDKPLFNKSTIASFFVCERVAVLNNKILSIILGLRALTSFQICQKCRLLCPRIDRTRQ